MKRKKAETPCTADGKKEMTAAVKQEYRIVRIIATNCFDESYIGCVVNKIRCRPDMLDSELAKLPLGRNTYYSALIRKESFGDICAEIYVFQGNKIIKRIKPKIANHL